METVVLELPEWRVQRLRELLNERDKLCAQISDGEHNWTELMDMDAECSVVDSQITSLISYPLSTELTRRS